MLDHLEGLIADPDGQHGPIIGVIRGRELLAQDLACTQHGGLVAELEADVGVGGNGAQGDTLIPQGVRADALDVPHV